MRDILMRQLRQRLELIAGRCEESQRLNYQQMLREADKAIGIMDALQRMPPPAVAAGMIPFTERWPDPDEDGPDAMPIKTYPRVLVTNDIAARDRSGRMSHIWLLSPIRAQNGGVIAYTDSGVRLVGLTHWLGLDALLTLTAAQRVAA